MSDSSISIAFVGLVFSLAATGCGSDGDLVQQGTVDTEEIAAVEAALGEATCPLTWPDWSCGDLTASPSYWFCYKQSAPNYDHATCRNAHIMEGEFSQHRLNNAFAAEYKGPDLGNTGYACDSAWIRMIVWRWENTQWQQVSDQIMYGMPTWPGDNYSRCQAPGWMQYHPTRSGRYKMAAQAGVIWTVVPVLGTISSFPQ